MDALLRSGLGLFAAAYAQLAMTPAAAALREQLLHTGDAPASAGEWVGARDGVAAAGLAGAAVGQLAFGLAGDVFGRRRPLVVAAALLTLGAALSAAASSAASDPGRRHLVAMLAAGRALAGLGLGGEFPLGATATAEHHADADAATRTRRVLRLWTLSASAAAVAAAFLGNLLAQALAMGDPGENASRRVEVVWRLVLAVGAAPAAFVGYYRLVAIEGGEQEPAAFAAARDKGHLTHQSGSVATVHHAGARLAFIARHYWRPLLGCAAAWFAWGVLSSAPTLLARRLLLAVVADANLPPSGDDDGWGLALQVWTAQNAVATLLTLPGYLLASFLAPSRCLGRSRLQLAGFLLLAVEFLLLGLFCNSVAVDSGAKPTTEEIAVLLVALVLASLLGTGGPGTTTFVLPTEMFPTAIGSTCFGVSAAAGRLGMAVGTFAIAPAVQTSMQDASLAFAATATVGAAVTWFCCSDCDLSFDERDEQLERHLVRDASRSQRRTSTLNRSRGATDAAAELAAPARWNGRLSLSSSDRQDTLEISERVRRRFAIDSGEIVHYEEFCGTPGGASNAAAFA